MRFLFDGHMLDIEQRELRRGAEPVALEPLVFDLLVYLVVNRDRVVSKDNLLDAVWSGRIVSESALASRIAAVRRADSHDFTQRLPFRRRGEDGRGRGRRAVQRIIRPCHRNPASTRPGADAVRHTIDRGVGIREHE